VRCKKELFSRTILLDEEKSVFTTSFYAYEGFNPIKADKPRTSRYDSPP